MLSRKFRKTSEQNKRAFELFTKLPYSENYTKEILWSHDGHYTMASGVFKDRVEAERYKHDYLKEIVEGKTSADRANYIEENEHLFSIKTTVENNELTSILTFPIRLLNDERLIDVQRIIFSNGLDSINIEKGLRRLNIDQNRSRSM